MAPAFLDPGLFNRRVAIERNLGRPDGAGGLIDAWTEIGETAARVEPLSAEVRERFSQRIGTVTHRVTLRQRVGLDRGDAFRLGARRLVIRWLHDPDETGRYLVCRCEEEA
ncbi:phage head closure protein [Aureimonas pseudogalii]|uniref:SPP1 family predicted phage head-tail adaptor n=1 Tax=Aureimonas pseudogalii TaxID=1744844 RepID=A0A7W6H371_9HYPH|nr:phage head closure protein [Aureimonas pseudogalii]MBB3996573.1 SPP1 family predicted phage head-tail adaptor [Aureimonas pseudogalii]